MEEEALEGGRELLNTSREGDPDFFRGARPPPRGFWHRLLDTPLEIIAIDQASTLTWDQAFDQNRTGGLATQLRLLVAGISDASDQELLGCIAAELARLDPGAKVEQRYRAARVAGLRQYGIAATVAPGSCGEAAPGPARPTAPSKEVATCQRAARFLALRDYDSWQIGCAPLVDHRRNKATASTIICRETARRARIGAAAMNSNWRPSFGVPSGTYTVTTANTLGRQAIQLGPNEKRQGAGAYVATTRPRGEYQMWLKAVSEDPDSDATAYWHHYAFEATPKARQVEAARREAQAEAAADRNERAADGWQRLCNPKPVRPAPPVPTPALDTGTWTGSITVAGAPHTVELTAKIGPARSDGSRDATFFCRDFPFGLPAVRLMPTGGDRWSGRASMGDRRQPVSLDVEVQAGPTATSSHMVEVRLNVQQFSTLHQYRGTVSMDL